MAILNQIRQRSLFLIIVIALALFSFVLADVFKNVGSSDLNQSVLAEVNGTEIDRFDFNLRLENLKNSANNASSSNTQLMKSTWDSELRRTLITQEFEKIGFRVEKSMMRNLIKESLSSYPSFQNESGEFSEAKLNQFLINLKDISPETIELETPTGVQQVTYQSWNNFEKSLEESKLVELYFKLVESGINTTLLEGEFDHVSANSTVDFKYVKIPFDNIPDSIIKVNQSDLNQFISENKSNYKTDPSRDFIFVKFDEVPSTKDLKNIEAKLNSLTYGSTDNNEIAFINSKNNSEFLNLNSEISFFDSYVPKNLLPSDHADKIYELKPGEVYGPYESNGFMKMTKLIESKQIPDSAKVRIITIPGQIFGSINEAEKFSDSIYNIIRNDRKEFLPILKQFDPNPESTGEVDLSYSDMNLFSLQDLRSFAFESRVGSLKLISTNNNYIIVEILKHGKKQRAVKIGDLAIELEPSEFTRDSIFSIASRFEISANDDNFRDYAQQNDYKIITANNIEEFAENIPVAGSQRKIVKWSFEDATDVGDIKSFRLDEGGYIIAMLTSINDEGLMSEGKSKTIILPQVKKQKKAEKIIENTRDLTSLEEIATEYSLEIKNVSSVNINNPQIPGVGSEPYVVGFANGQPINKLSRALKGNSGVFFIVTTSRSDAAKLDNYQSAANKLNTIRSGSTISGAFNSLKNSAEIKDYRGLFY